MTGSRGDITKNSSEPFPQLELIPHPRGTEIEHVHLCLLIGQLKDLAPLLHQSYLRNKQPIKFEHVEQYTAFTFEVAKVPLQ